MEGIQKNQRIIKNSIILYFRTFVTMLVGMFTTRVILQTLGEVDLGLYNVVGGVVMMLASIQGSLSAASSRFLTYAIGKGDSEKLKCTFRSVFTVHLILAVVSIVLFETIGLYLFHKLNIPEGREFACLICYQFSIATSFLTLLSIPFTAIVVAHEQMGFYAYLTFLDVFLKLMILYVMVYFPYDKLITYGGLLFITTIVGMIVNVIYSYRKYKETSMRLLFSIQDVFPILKFSGWTAIGHFSNTLEDQGGNYLLNIFFGPSINAARSLSMQVGAIICRFVSGFQTAINPQIIKSYAMNELDYMHKLICTSSVYSFFVVFVSSFSVYFVMPNLLELWLGNYPEYTILFIRIILIRTLFSLALANPLQTALNATASLKTTNIVISICYCLSLIATYICLTLGLGPGTVFALSLLINIVIVLLRVLILVHLIGFSFIEYVKSVLLRSLCPCLLVILLYGVIDTFFIINNPFIKVIVPFLLSIVVIFVIGLSNVERKYIIKGFLHTLKISK